MGALDDAEHPGCIRNGDTMFNKIQCVSYSTDPPGLRIFTNGFMDYDCGRTMEGLKSTRSLNCENDLITIHSEARLPMIAPNHQILWGLLEDPRWNRITLKFVNGVIGLIRDASGIQCEVTQCWYVEPFQIQELKPSSWIWKS